MAAQSLKCNDCGAILRSVKEAQDHAEVTKHSNFSESTEKLLRLVCTECGKVARSQVEKDLHTKRTGHAMFDDKTDEAEGINTEAEMKEAQDALNDLETDKPPASNQPPKLIPAVVTEAHLEQMLSMGFPRNRAIRALHASGDSGVDVAVNWLAEHEEDADIDEELLVPEAPPPKQVLSAEEAKAKAAELVRKAREKREREEAEMEKLREAERVRAGKELVAAQKLEEELRLKRIIEERKREKEEEERAREKIRAKLEADRRERRRRLGLPEELTEEEKAEEARKMAERAEEENRKKLPVKPAAAAEKMRVLLVDMKKNHGSDQAKLTTAWQTLFKFCANVAKAPSEEKFRRIKLSNPAVQQRIGSISGCVEFLELAGFEKEQADGGEALFMPEDKVNILLLQAAGEQLDSALNNPFFGAL